ncbi:MAG: hypothetical protein WB676_22325 [Bryobacteraceae bacterium]
MERSLRLAELKSQVMMSVRGHLIVKYGPASEKLSDAELGLLELEPGVSQLDVRAESERERLAKRSNHNSTRKHWGGGNYRRIYPTCEERNPLHTEQMQV